jgi:branched-chain amino acid transport system ATP-binding protein
MLEVTNLTSTYDGIAALRDASLRVDDGSIVALIGSNGAGKTTLLNTVSGFVTARSGSVKFDSAEILGLKSHRIARMGILQVPEGRQVLGPLSVMENLLLGRLASKNRSGSAGDLDTVFELFPKLRERVNQLSGSLSGGEQQMLAIGRALMGDPKLLLLDEPSLGLAPKIVDTVFEALGKLNARGLSILLVEQNARRALEIASTAYVIETGSVIRSGSGAELLQDPDISAHYLGGSVQRNAVKPTNGISR